MCIERPNVSPDAKLTPTQAASVLEISRRTMYNLLKGGRLTMPKEAYISRSGRLIVTGRGVLKVWNNK